MFYIYNVKWVWWTGQYYIYFRKQACVTYCWMKLLKFSRWYKYVQKDFPRWKCMNFACNNTCTNIFFHKGSYPVWQIYSFNSWHEIWPQQFMFKGGQYEFCGNVDVGQQYFFKMFSSSKASTKTCIIFANHSSYLQKSCHFGVTVWYMATRFQSSQHLYNGIHTEIRKFAPITHLTINNSWLYYIWLQK